MTDGRYSDNWQRLADDFFTRLPAVPADLRAEVDLLRHYNDERQALAVTIQEIRAELARQRAAKIAVKKRVDAIAARQNFEAYLEQQLAELRRHNAKMARLKREIDRVTDKIIRELRQRDAQAERERRAREKFAQMEQRRQQARDLAAWEAFKAGLLGEPAPEPDATAAEQHAEAERLRQEYERIKAQKPPNEAENLAAWQDFVNSLSDDDP
ncbi:MAG: hypothetical protein ACLFTK_14210 [Anaerolineales bacterium]